MYRSRSLLVRPVRGTARPVATILEPIDESLSPGYAGLKASVVLVPPKPNELFRAMRIFAARGLFGT
jgi:hypothetical protein